MAQARSGHRRGRGEPRVQLGQTLTKSGGKHAAGDSVPESPVERRATAAAHGELQASARGRRPESQSCQAGCARGRCCVLAQHHFKRPPGHNTLVGGAIAVVAMDFRAGGDAAALLLADGMLFFSRASYYGQRQLAMPLGPRYSSRPEKQP